MIGSLFGPIKYGILPDHLARRELPAGNALVEGATFIAILLGTIVAGLAAKGGGHPLGFSTLVMTFAVLCWISSLFIPRTGEAAPNLIINKNIATSTWSLIQHLRSDQRLWWGALVTSWFWLVGVVVLSLLPPAVKSLVGGNEETVTAYLAVFSIAVAIGSGLAAWLCAGRIILLPTLLGALCLGIFSLFMGFTLWGAPVAKQFLGPTEIFADRPRHQGRDRAGRSCDRRRPVHRAGLRRGAGLGRRRPARARGRRGQRAQCAVHDRCDLVRRGAAGQRRHHPRCCSSGSAS